MPMSLPLPLLFLLLVIIQNVFGNSVEQIIDSCVFVVISRSETLLDLRPWESHVHEFLDQILSVGMSIDYFVILVNLLGLGLRIRLGLLWVRSRNGVELRGVLLVLRDGEGGLSLRGLRGIDLRLGILGSGLLGRFDGGFEHHEDDAVVVFDI